MTFSCPFRLAIILLLAQFSLSACMPSDEQQAREATESFWQAVLNNDMETAKQQVTWESVQYLQFLRSQQIDADGVETGELLITDGIAEVATVLYGGENRGIKVPLRTVLIRHESGWLIDVQKTMGSMVSGTMGSIVEQLNNFMQDGLKGLDDSLSQSLDELGKSLENGLDELKKELEQPQPSTTNQSQQQAI